MSNPFLIEGPAVISFSGGRTSGYMLRRILDAGLRPDVHVLFANTGKEREETLTFVHEIETRWDVLVRWLEYRRMVLANDTSAAYFEEVTYHTASRDGEPFDALLNERSSLPNPAQRWCTQELKIRLFRDFMRGQGHEHWDSIVGIRADEFSRVANMREADQQRKERWSIALPLADAGITKADVMAFWKIQPFDLRLRPYEGNCDICFLKHVNKRERLAKDRPDLLRWWVGHEARTGQFFRKDEPEYAILPKIGNLFDDIDLDGPDATECFCHD
jgi:3'-phosphoadenosine 5'-phosphosulfate sulfotransferase (PAPS reductase)/FAD synthetase